MGSNQARPVAPAFRRCERYSMFAALRRLSRVRKVRLVDIGIYWGALPASLTASAESTPTIEAGSLLIDWTNPATGMAVNRGAVFDRAPVGDLALVTVVNSMGFLTSLPSGLVTISTYKIVPQDHAEMNLATVMAEQQLGAYPIGRGSAVIRRTMPPNIGRVR
jgi:hypothetical protein